MNRDRSARRVPLYPVTCNGKSEYKKGINCSFYERNEINAFVIRTASCLIDIVLQIKTIYNQNSLGRNKINWKYINR